MQMTRLPIPSSAYLLQLCTDFVYALFAEWLMGTRHISLRDTKQSIIHYPNALLWQRFDSNSVLVEAVSDIFRAFSCEKIKRSSSSYLNFFFLVIAIITSVIRISPYFNAKLNEQNISKLKAACKITPSPASRVLLSYRTYWRAFHFILYIPIFVRYPIYMLYVPSITNRSINATFLKLYIYM